MRCVCEAATTSDAASKMSYKYVVLGGGNASGYAAKEFVASGKLNKDELAVITDEPVVAYERPALSKAYLNPESPPRLPGFHTTVGGGGEKQDPAWYANHGIQYLTSTHVTAADVSAKKLTLSTGGNISYDKLIVATGARPVYLTEFKTPGAELQGLYYLRNVEDADKLVAAMKEAKAGSGKAVVVGGGYIGLEVAAGLVNNGLQVTVVMPEPHVLARLFTPTIAAFYEKFYEGKGVKFVHGAKVTGFEGKDGKVTTVVASVDDKEQKMEAALVVVGIGARPNAELFKDQLALEAGGIKVNGKLQSSDPNVYAVGDVAAFPLSAADGKVIRQEHVQHARTSAAHAVKSILGATDDYEYLPYFYSREFNLAWVFYGLSEGEVVHFGDFSAGKFGAYWVRDGKVVGAFLESGSNEENAAVKAIAAKRPDAGSLEDLAKAGISFATSKM